MCLSDKITSQLDEMSELFYSQALIAKLTEVELTEKEKIGLSKVKDLAAERFEIVKDEIVGLARELSQVEVMFAVAQLDRAG